MLSFDIETSPDAGRLYSIAAAGAGGEQRVDRRTRARSRAPRPCRTSARCSSASSPTSAPPIPTCSPAGTSATSTSPCCWRACQRTGLRCTLGRNDDELELQRDQNFTRESRALLAGRVVLDGLALVRGAFIRLDDYRLETAARTLLGKGKLISGEHRVAEIETAYRDDPARLAAYNLQDARLVLEMLAQHRVWSS